MKSKKVTISLIIFLIVFIFFFIMFDKNSNPAGKPFFLRCLGDFVAVGENGDIDLSLVYIDSKNNPILLQTIEKSNISFNDESIEIEKYEITKGDEFGEIALYSLNLKLGIKKDTCLLKELIFSNSKGKNEKFNIGKITIHRRTQTSDELEVTKNTGLSSRLNRYEFSLENKFLENINIKKIETGQFSSFIDTIKYDTSKNLKEETEYLGGEIQLPKDSIVNVTIYFNCDEYDYYIHNPSVIYEVKGKEIKLSPYYATYGLSYNDKQMARFETMYKGRNNN